MADKNPRQRRVYPTKKGTTALNMAFTATGHLFQIQWEVHFIVSLRAIDKCTNLDFPQKAKVSGQIFEFRGLGHACDL